MAEEGQSASPQQPKKGMPVKTLLLLGGVLLIEAAVITVAFVAFGSPAKVKAEGAEVDEQAIQEQPVEELVVAGRFPNTKRGRTYIYDTEVFVVVKRKHHEKIKEKIEGMAAQINGDVRVIIGRAEPNHLLEPTLATLKRQIRASLDQRIGVDEDGNSRIQDVVITRFTQFRADL